MLLLTAYLLIANFLVFPIVNRFPRTFGRWSVSCLNCFPAVWFFILSFTCLVFVSYKSWCNHYHDLGREEHHVHTNVLPSPLRIANARPTSQWPFLPFVAGYKFYITMMLSVTNSSVQCLIITAVSLGTVCYVSECSCSHLPNSKI